MSKPLDPFRFLLIAVAGWMNQHQLYCHKFVTADWGQRKDLTEIAAEVKISSEVLSFEDFELRDCRLASCIFRMRSNG